MRVPAWVSSVVLGVFVGLVDVIPGVSGGTVLLLAHRYYRFTEAMSTVPSSLRAAVAARSVGPLQTTHVVFLSHIGSGALTGAAIGSVVIGIALAAAEAATAAVFIGVITVGAVLVVARTDRDGVTALSLVCGVAVGVGLSFMSVNGLPTSVVTVLFASMIASSATVLPGVSGAFVLYALGQYEYILVEGVTSLPSVLNGAVEPLGIVASLGIGGSIGALGMSRVARRVMEAHENAALGGFAGLMLGTVRVAVVDATAGTLALPFVLGLAVAGGGGLAVLWWVTMSSR